MILKSVMGLLIKSASFFNEAAARISAFFKRSVPPPASSRYPY